MSATFKLTGNTFPEGTTVKAYPASNWPTPGQPSGAPIGSSSAESTVASGSVTFSNLTADTDYWAVAKVGSRYRYVGFTAGEDLADSADHASKADVEAKQDASTAATDTELAAEKAGREAGDATRQPLDSDLSAIAALETTAFGRALLGKSNAGQVREALEAAQVLGYTYLDHGLTSCTVLLPETASTGFSPESGKPVYYKVPVRNTTDFSTVKYNVSTGGTGATALANCFVDVVNSAGVRLGVSADQSAAWATSGDKSTAIVADSEKSLVVTGSLTAFVYIGFLAGTQSTTPVAFRSTSGSSGGPNFNLSAANRRSFTVGSGKTSPPTSVTPSEGSAVAGLVMVGA